MYTIHTFMHIDLLYFNIHLKVRNWFNYLHRIPETLTEKHRQFTTVTFSIHCIGQKILSYVGILSSVKFGGELSYTTKRRATH